MDEAEIKPFRIKYYCENRDPDFDSKMHNVLLVYKQLSMQFDEDGHLIPWAEDKEFVHVLSYDEKPGIQATATTSEDLLPDERHSTISRDYEYKRLETLSLLAGIDLQTGEAIPLVSETHNSKDYIEFLKILEQRFDTNKTMLYFFYKRFSLIDAHIKLMGFCDVTCAQVRYHNNLLLCSDVIAPRTLSNCFRTFPTLLSNFSLISFNRSLFNRFIFQTKNLS